MIERTLEDERLLKHFESLTENETNKEISVTIALKLLRIINNFYSYLQPMEIQNYKSNMEKLVELLKTTQKEVDEMRHLLETSLPNLRVYSKDNVKRVLSETWFRPRVEEFTGGNEFNEQALQRFIKGLENALNHFLLMFAPIELFSYRIKSFDYPKLMLDPGFLENLYLGDFASLERNFKEVINNDNERTRFIHEYLKGDQLTLFLVDGLIKEKMLKRIDDRKYDFSELTSRYFSSEAISLQIFNEYIHTHNNLQLLKLDDMCRVIRVFLAIQEPNDEP